jgi:acetate kinase
LKAASYSSVESPNLNAIRGNAMPKVLVFNPGSNSLKFELVEVQQGQRFASEGKPLWRGAIDNIGAETAVELYRGSEKVIESKIASSDFTEATETAWEALSGPDGLGPNLQDKIDKLAIRVVHGGDDFIGPVRFTKTVERQIEKREALAPLHNANSLRIARVIEQRAPSVPIVMAFDTAFHHTIPEHAWRYPLPRALADKHSIRKFGFHGISHRYLMERYAQLVGQATEDISIVTLHLESGSSAAAIRSGQSIDTSMGFTPLEGLMMGTRCGSIDPAIFPYLMREENLNAEEVLNVLERYSGLLGVSGISLDTRILRKSADPAARQAIEIFAYRVRQCVGSYLAVLEDAQAIVFGGGIGENTPEVRAAVCDGLRGWGLQLDNRLQSETMSGDARISTSASKLAVWVIHSEEGLQLAHECTQIE